MNASSSPFSSSPSPAADEQAALWAVRLEGAPLSPEDHAALQAWMAEDRTHAERLAEYRQLSFDLDQQLPALAKAGGMAFPPAPAPVFARPSRTWSWIFGLAGAGAAAILAIAVWRNHEASLPELMLTPTGGRRSFTMADGTQVELNAATRLMIEKSSAERRVRLDDGEAYFHVAKDRNHPFIVETPAGSVRVTGTVFDVRSEAPGQLEVTVVEGTVQVRPLAGSGFALGDAVLLKAGDRLSATTQGVALAGLSSEQVSNALAWRQGKAIFVDVPVREALETFARYHQQKLTVSDAAAKELVGGMFGLNNLDGFLAALEAGLHLRVTRAADGSVQVSLQSEP